MSTTKQRRVWVRSVESSKGTCRKIAWMSRQMRSKCHENKQYTQIRTLKSEVCTNTNRVRMDWSKLVTETKKTNNQNQSAVGELKVVLKQRWIGRLVGAVVSANFQNFVLHSAFVQRHLHCPYSFAIVLHRNPFFADYYCACLSTWHLHFERHVAFRIHAICNTKHQVTLFG